MLRALKERLLGLCLGALLMGLPLALLLPGLSPLWLLAMTAALLWLWRLARKLGARLATRALARGESKRARRWYRLLMLSTIDSEARQACRLSLAACAATEAHYERALQGLGALGEGLEPALLAVAHNLRAYCLARSGRDLEDALRLSEASIALRPRVPGFRHTRGLILLEMGRVEEAVRDLEATWTQGDGNELLEAERCYDLGRLWRTRGHADYAVDYFERALRAAPESRWAEAARPMLSRRAPSRELEALL